MKIQKRTGEIVPFDKERIVTAIYKALRAVGKDNIELAKSLADEVVKKTEEKYQNNEMPTVEGIQDIVESVLIAKDQAVTAKAYILYRQKRTELRKIKQGLLNGLIDDSKLSLNGLLIAKERYLLKDENNNVIETPLQMFRRVAKTASQVEKKYSKESKAIEEYEEKFYNIISTLKFVPGGRILANSGTKNRMMYSSFVIKVPDSMKGIFKALLEKALIQRLGGGTGFSFSRLRPKGTQILYSNAVASGPVAFIDLFDHASRLTLQKGNRLGANMGSLSIEHPDIIDFITAKDRLGLENFNISVEVTDDFMQAVEKNKYYELKDPLTKSPVKKIRAKQVFDILVFMAWKNADPGVLFIDRINKDNPTPKLGRIETTDPCGDLPMQAYDASPIGAINLAKFVTAKKIDWEDFGDTVKLAVRFLDNIIDASKFPFTAIEKTVLANRRIGLGVLGWADMLYQLKISYESDEAYELGEKLAKFMRDKAKESSEELANEKGAFPNFKKSIFKDKQRNASLLAIAPTGSRGILAESSPAIEPHFALGYRRTVFGNVEISYLNPFFENTSKEEGFYSEELMKKVSERGSIQELEEVPQKIKKMFLTAHDISPEGHIKMQSAFQKYIDNAISKTINFPEDATITDVEQTYFLAWKQGCKGITVYRDKSRERQVINI